MLLMVNVDNISIDALPYMIDGIFSLGAKNVNVVNAMTKKGRMGYLFFIDTEAEFVDFIAEFLAREAGTLGLRILQSEHRKYEYRFHKVRLQAAPGNGAEPPLALWISVKMILEGEQVLSARAEYRELEAALRQLQALGHPVPMNELRAEVELAALKGCRLCQDWMVEFQPDGVAALKMV